MIEVIYLRRWKMNKKLIKEWENELPEHFNKYYYDEDEDFGVE